MKNGYHISLVQWNRFLGVQADEYNIYVPVKKDAFIDYDLFNFVPPSSIVYNHPKPITPLKLFFLPVKENVTVDSIRSDQKVIIIGTPSCDLEALDILDEMYLASPFVDSYYKKRRENTILIGTDCHSVLEHCHCTTYGVQPYPTKNHDVSLSVLKNKVFLLINSEKGEAFIRELKKAADIIPLSEGEIERIHSKRENTRKKLEEQNAGLPGYKETEELIKHSDASIWEKYSRACVACGGCAAICPTCTCFLLIDRPGFEKVRQMDACQYPGFSRIAAGEDHLKDRAHRFKNRYQCKYVWKPGKFSSIACTGCGRCIETCIGRINKNELFMELASHVEA